jgi:DNA polymerase III epsilon subunit-like protein
MTTQTPVHVMIDIETVGLKPGCAILAIGATTFSYQASIQHKFYAVISTDSSEKAGFEFDTETLRWWNSQDAALRTENLSGVIGIQSAMIDFHRWLTQLAKEEDLYVWGNGAGFDIPILEYAFREFNIPAPWNFRNVRCYRTLKSLFGHFISGSMPMQGTKHLAIDDAIYQAQCAAVMLTRYANGMGIQSGGRL